MSELPMWFCNKCGRAGKTATRDEARAEHKRRSPSCDYAPAWNWVGFNDASRVAPVPASDPSWSTPNPLQLQQLEWHPTRSREIL